MFVRLLRISLFSAVLVALLAGCASAVTPTPTSNPVPVTAPTSAPVAAPTSAPLPAATPTTGAAAANPSSNDIVRLVAVPGKSKASYRVREQLANLQAPSDAVGTTTLITGTVVGKMDGTIISSDSKFVVDLSTLKSDSNQRDNFLRRNTLETSQYPTATFAPKSTTGLPTSIPASGQATFKLTGDLTIRNVTKPVTWDVSCQTQSNTQGTCRATTSFTFTDFGLTKPSVFSVLSIVDNIILEVEVDLQRASS